MARDPFGHSLGALVAPDRARVEHSTDQCADALANSTPALALFSEDFVCVLRRAHPALPARLTLKSFARLRHLLVSPEGEGPALVDHVLGKAGLSREIALRIPHFLVAPTLVASSDMVATLPRRIVTGSAMSARLKTFAPPFEAGSFTMVAAWHARRLEEPAVRWFRDLVVEVAAAL